MSSQGSVFSTSSSGSPLPPPDLGTYTRSMHQHTKRQMEAISPPNAGTQGSSPPSNQQGPTSLPNGLSSRGRNPSDYSYHS